MTENRNDMEPGTGSDRHDFFISYATEDRGWARWIAQVLAESGYSVRMQDWDFLPGSDWVHEMHRAAIDCGSTLAVLSHSYLRSTHGEAEWRAAYSTDPSGELGRLIPVRVDDVSPPGLLGTRVYVDIADLGEQEARLELLKSVHRQAAANSARRSKDSGKIQFPGRHRPVAAPATSAAAQLVPDSMLSDYLRAVATQYEELPYISLRTGARLSSVYVAQYIEDISVASPRGSSGSLLSAPRRTGDTIIDSDAHVLIEGGPGAGKSSLIGHIATQLATGGSYLPAVVRANTLRMMRGTFSERLRKAVTEELGGRLIEPLHDEFFAAVRAGRRWLVLVDCLDEIISQRHRAKLVEDLLHLSTVVDSPYRILIATRHVQTESQHDWSGFSRLRLLPLTDEQIATFTESWFRVNAGAGGADVEQRFIGELRNRGLIELLRTPLVLTMAASVFAPDATHTLPRNRSGIYERFLTLVDDEESERRTRIAFREAWDQRYGHRGEAVADDIFSSRRQILEHLAADRQEGATIALLDSTAGYVRRNLASRDDLKIDPEWLAQQGAVLLDRSALVVPVGADYEFVHETVREYLVAAGLTRGGLIPGDSAALELVQQWRTTSWRQVILFLLGIWSNQGEDVDGVLSLIRDESPEGVVYAANAMAEGIRVSCAVRDATIRALGSQVRSMSWGQVLFSDPNPFRVMVSLGGALCAEELLTVALDRAAEPPVRAYSAEILSELEPDTRTIEALTTLSHESHEVMVRHGAATALARLGRLEIALPVLEDVICDPGAGLLLRSRAVDTLGRHKATESLLRVATLANLDSSLREIAAAYLEEHGDSPQAARTLTALIEDDRVAARVRERAVHDLSRGSEVDALREIADNATTGGWVRVLAAMHLVQAGDQAGAFHRLRALAHDSRQDERVRLRAVHNLCTLNDEEGLLALVKLADGLVRLAAASGAPKRGNLDVLLATVREMATDATLEPDVRHEAADLLQRLGATAEAAKLLLNMTRSGAFPSYVKEEAVLSLCDGRHMAELLAICEDTTLPNWLRVSGCDALSQISDRSEIASRPFFANLRESVDGWLRPRMESLAKGSPA